MLTYRVIPALLLRNDGLVKTTKFKDPKYVGDPINAIHIFNEKEVDELMLLDITASKERREPNYALIEQIAGECFMPLAYGGGVQTLEQAKRIFSLGVEKVCVQTAALENPGLISELSERFGSQSIMVSVDIKKNWFGKPGLYAAANGKLQSTPWKDALRSLVAAGAGEVLLNAVDKDGTLSGPDLGLIREASSTVDVPVIAVGGISSLADIKAAVRAGASAVAAGAFFVFHGPHRAVLITYPSSEKLMNMWVENEK
jgi:cyclase